MYYDTQHTDPYRCLGETSTNVCSEWKQPCNNFTCHKYRPPQSLLQYRDQGPSETKQGLAGSWTYLEVMIKSPTFLSPEVAAHSTYGRKCPPLTATAAKAASPISSKEIPQDARGSLNPSLSPTVKGLLSPTLLYFSPPSFPAYPIFHGSQAALNQALAEQQKGVSLFSSKHLF